MPIGEYTAFLTHRNSAYALLLIAVALGALFLFGFNFTNWFGGGTP